MKKALCFGQNMNDSIPYWFNTHFNTDSDYYPIQDIIHIGTKFRNRVLNKELKFGKRLISIQHLRELLKNVTKEKHKLTESVISPNDRQNFQSVLRICNERIIDLLASNVPNSTGTIFYLRIISNILRSFLDLTLNPLKRIRMIWFAIFMLRIWKLHIIETKGKVDTQFISSNCYSCVEISGHSLVLIILYLKEKNLDHCFCPELLGSQPCESTFRQVRSLSSTYSTVTNLTLLEIMKRMTKIEFQNDIMFNKLPEYSFPRLCVDTSSYYPKSNRNGEKYTAKLLYMVKANII